MSFRGRVKLSDWIVMDTIRVSQFDRPHDETCSSLVRVYRLKSLLRWSLALDVDIGTMIRVLGSVLR